MKQFIRRILRYQHQIRHNSDIFETKDGQRYKKECICCKRFSNTPEQYKNEVGICTLCGLVSEWSTCKIFKVKQHKI